MHVPKGTTSDLWFPNPDTSPTVLVNADSEAWLTGLRCSTAWMTRAGEPIYKQSRLKERSASPEISDHYNHFDLNNLMFLEMSFNIQGAALAATVRSEA